MLYRWSPSRCTRPRWSGRRVLRKGQERCQRGTRRGKGVIDRRMTEPYSKHGQGNTRRLSIWCRITFRILFEWLRWICRIYPRLTLLCSSWIWLAAWHYIIFWKGGTLALWERTDRASCINSINDNSRDYHNIVPHRDGYGPYRERKESHCCNVSCTC